MAAMTELVLVVCGAVVKAAIKLWVGDNAFADDLSGDLTDMLKGQVGNALDRRRAHRQFLQLEEIVARQLLATLEHEFRDLDEGEREAAIRAVGETISRARLTDKILFAGNLDPLYLENYVRKFTGTSTRDLSWGGTALYDRVLAQCCAYIIEIADKLPRFQAGAFAELLQRDSQILARIEEVLDRLPAPSRDDSATDRVATAYRRRIVKEFDRLELFGLDFAAQWYSLSIAYVNLKVSVDAESQYSDAPFESWLGACPRLLIDGRAGSGKTTILQWIAVRAARGDFEGLAAGLNGYIPFFIRLREYAETQDGAGITLPAPENFLDKVAPLLAPEAPAWPRAQLRSGRAFVLVDGMDELPEGQRPAVLAWLRELTDLFPDIRCVVTSRPGAVEKTDFEATGFAWAALEPMEPALIRTFVDQWHRAMREWQKDERSQEQLTALRTELTRALDDDRFLSELANTPLLAGLICALNQHLAGQLPRRRSEIFEKALAMFYERDRKRGIRGTVALDLAATYHLLGELALRLVRGGLVEIDEESARQALQRAAATLPNGPYDGSELYRHLLLRSGLLREPTTGCIDFVHRTFQEYLAARALVESDSIAEIVRNAEDDQWREVVVLAAGQTNIRQTTDLLRGLLRTNWRGKERYRCRLLAIASLEEIHGADPGILSAVERVIPELVPPRSMADAEALSHAGDRLIPHLARVVASAKPEELAAKPEELAATIRAAALIGGPGALRLLSDIARQYPGPAARHFAVHSEFDRAWQYFEPETYAAQVLAPAEITQVSMSDARNFSAIRRLPSVRSVTLLSFVDDTAVLSPLADTRITSLWLEQCRLRSLTGAPWPSSQLKELELRFCDQLSDISVISQLTNLESLSIVYCPKITDYTAIARLSNLRSLSLNSQRKFDFTLVASLPLLTRLSIAAGGQVNLAPLSARTGLEIKIYGSTEISGVGEGFQPTLEKRTLSGRSFWLFR